MLDPLKTLASTLAVLFVSLALPGIASAATFFVNTTEDETHFEGCVNSSSECSLRDAIERGNESEGEADTIEFEMLAPPPIELQSQLPAIVDPLTIDGTTADDYAGTPVIEIDASGAATTTGGLVVEAGQTEVIGISITGADGPGLFFASGSEGVACANYLGVDTTGAAAGNGSGIQIGNDAEKANLGGPDCGNLISGNDGSGIAVEGFDTNIASNLIGTDASGKAPMPNAGNGIRTTFFADSTAIGAIGNASGNTIAFNGGAGVLVESADAIVAIYGNSIFDNGDLGIKIPLGDALTPPTLEAVKYTAPVSISGTVTGEPNETYFIDFYANAACDPSGSGEGQTYLADWEVTTDASGIGKFTATEETGPGEGEEGIDPIPAGQDVITATATTQFGEAGEGTSEFSKCLSGEKVTPPPPPPPPPPPLQPIAQAQLVPENGETLAVEPVSGVIYIKLPGKAKQVKLTEGMLIPVGSVVDASKGKVTLTSVNKAGETQTAVFYGGKFLVAQRDGSGLVTLKLRGGNLSGCKNAEGSSATASAGRKGRRLWGSGKGKFRTEGNNGSATVRGTVWLTEDRCTGTFFKVKQGVVTVRDFAANETFPLGKGKTYLATP